MGGRSSRPLDLARVGGRRREDRAHVALVGVVAVFHSLGDVPAVAGVELEPSSRIRTVDGEGERAVEHVAALVTGVRVPLTAGSGVELERSDGQVLGARVETDGG